MDHYEQDNCIRRHHIYQNIWSAEVDEHFVCEREPLNSSDRGFKGRISLLVGSCPNFLLVLLESGTIDCVVIGGRRYSSDLPQEGLEIPYKLIFNGKRDDIKKLSEISSGS